MFGRTKSNISNGNFPFSEINDKNLNFGRDYTLGDFIYEDLLHCTVLRYRSSWQILHNKIISFIVFVKW